MKIRDKINKTLEIEKISKVIIFIIQKSFSENSILITITVNYIVKDLL